jgi:hypothetical protein
MLKMDRLNWRSGKCKDPKGDENVVDMIVFLCSSITRLCRERKLARCKIYGDSEKNRSSYLNDFKLLVNHSKVDQKRQTSDRPIGVEVEVELEAMIGFRPIHSGDLPLRQRSEHI